MRSLIKCLSLGLALAGLTSAVVADDATPAAGVTFNKDVAPIFQQNCATCHRQAGTNLSGMIAPMSLETYADARPWAKSIAKKVESREMPPWHATKESHGVFKNERTLTDKEIETIKSWVAAGAPAGNPADAPKPRVYATTDGWSIGKPDLVVKFDKPFLVKDEVWDMYQNIPVKLTDAMLPEDRYIAALEFKPGSDVVHHIIAYAFAPGSASANMDRGMIGGMAPGTDPARYPEGYGLLLKKGSTINFQMHYHKEKGPGTAKEDNSSLALIFHKGPVPHALTIDAISNGRFEIPPLTSNWKVGMSRIFDKDTTIISLMPHTHLRGTGAKYVAFYPDGKTETLLDVPKYDFNWQTEYEFKEPKRIPAGTRLEATLWYDNSLARKELAPEIDPTKAIRFGGPTTDEMDLAWLTTTPTAPNVAGAVGATGGAGGGK